MDFGQATFESGADLRGVTFPGPVFFDDTKFGGPLFLDRACFLHEAWFLRTRLTEGQFTETTFDRLAGFHRVTATRSLTFTGSVFSGRTDFDRIHAAKIDFTDATFSKRASTLLFGPDPMIRFNERVLPLPSASQSLATCLLAGAQFDQGLELRLDYGQHPAGRYSPRCVLHDHQSSHPASRRGNPWL